MTERQHILVVDDIATNRKLLSALLTFEGYRVSEAADGAEALAMTRSDTPQLVISDILMPSMDGYEFVRRLREDPATSGLRVIFYTANYHESEARSLADQCGVSRVIVKPCPAPDLVIAVAQVLEGSVAPPPSPPEAGFDVEHLRLLTDKLSQNANTLRATNSRLGVLTELNLQMASEHDPSQLLRSVCAGARKLLGSRFSILAVVDKRQPERVAVYTTGLPYLPRHGIADPREDTGVLGRVYAQRTSQRLSSRNGRPLDLGLPAGYPEIRAAVAVPVCSLTRTYGWLCLGQKLGADAFSAEDERLLTILAAQLGRIYENGSLFREVQEQAAQLMVEMEERSRTTEQLRLSEERLRELAENIHDVFFVSDPVMARTSYVSPGYARVWGRPVDSVLNREGGWIEAVHPDDQERVREEVQQIVRAFPAEGNLEFRIVRPDGALRWVFTRVFPIVDNGEIVRTVGVTQDITARKLAELRVMRLNRTLSVLSGINSLIVRANDRQTLLEDACRLAVAEGEFRLAWCGLLQNESELRPIATSGDGGDIAVLVNAWFDEPQSTSNFVAQAVRSSQPRFCNDLMAAEVHGVRRDLLLERGYLSAIALPLLIEGKVNGCLVLFAGSAGYFDEEEIRLLSELSDDISFALDHIDKAERLAWLATYDPVTGITNRTAFEARVASYVSVASHTRTEFAIVVADPERFEALNNTLGRAIGDEILRQAARRFARAAGGEDVSGHVGSDQFAAIIAGPFDGAALSHRLDALWRDWLETPFETQGHIIELTAKGGVALYPNDGATADILLVNATAALRDVKQGGKTIGFYTRYMSERFAERVALEKSLRRALENGEYELHYQPKVDLGHRDITGLEALLRWRRSSHDLVSPAAFIPLLEETGMIVEVGAWVMRQACHDRARWLALGLQAPRVAVNVSAIQLRGDEFVPAVAKLVQGDGKDAGLDLEVTESVLMDNVSQNPDKLAAIRNLGVGVALDDFGTGYSSLAYLAKLPVNTLKIDRTFVSQMLDDTSVMTLVSTIISLARSLRLSTVAEGVESEEQAKILRLLGCDEMQGYLFSRPVPFDDMTARLGSLHI
jgi:diguanylate cyclase